MHRVYAVSASGSRSVLFRPSGSVPSGWAPALGPALRAGPADAKDIPAQMESSSAALNSALRISSSRCIGPAASYQARASFGELMRVSQHAVRVDLSAAEDAHHRGKSQACMRWRYQRNAGGTTLVLASTDANISRLTDLGEVRRHLRAAARYDGRGSVRDLFFAPTSQVRASTIEAGYVRSAVCCLQGHQDLDH